MTASAAKVLRHIASGVESGLAQPTNIELCAPATGYKVHRLYIKIGDNAAGALPGWMNWFGLHDEITVGKLLSTTERPGWRAHKASGAWQGWGAEVSTYVDEPVEVPECICVDSNLPARPGCRHCYPAGPVVEFDKRPVEVRAVRPCGRTGCLQSGIHGHGTPS